VLARGDLYNSWGTRRSISPATSFAHRAERPHRTNAQARSHLGSVAQRSALPTLDRQIRGHPLTRRFIPRGFIASFERDLPFAAREISIDPRQELFADDLSVLHRVNANFRQLHPVL